MNEFYDIVISYFYIFFIVLCYNCFTVKVLFNGIIIWSIDYEKYTVCSDYHHFHVYIYSTEFPDIEDKNIDRFYMDLVPY